MSIDLSKFPIITKKNNQEVYRIIPYAKILNKTIKTNTYVQESPVEEEIQEERYIMDANLLDLSKPIDNIDDYL